MMSTEHAFAPGSKQYEFIKADLEKVNRHETPFLVLAGHRPMYVQNPGIEHEAEKLRKALEPLMRDHAVDVAFWGHVHSYQRTCAVYDFKCGDENKGTGTVHIVTGAPGAGLSAITGTKPDWMQFTNAEYHGQCRSERQPSVRVLSICLLLTLFCLSASVLLCAVAQATIACMCAIIK